MGVHVHLYRIGEKYTDRLPFIDKPGFKGECVDDEFGWDWIRHAGDRDLANYTESGPFLDETAWVSRPRDVEEMRSEMLKLGFNEDRWNFLADTLKANPDLWLYFSW